MKYEQQQHWTKTKQSSKHSIHFAKKTKMRNEKITNKQQHNVGEEDEEEKRMRHSFNALDIDCFECKPFTSFYD